MRFAFRSQDLSVSLRSFIIRPICGLSFFFGTLVPASALVCREASFLDETLSASRAAAEARRQAVEDVAKIGIIFIGRPRQWQHKPDSYSFVRDYDVRRWIKGGPGPYAQIEFGLMPGTPPPSDGVLSGASGDGPERLYAAWPDRSDSSDSTGSPIVSGTSWGCPRDIMTTFDKQELAGKPPAERAKWAAYRQALEQEFARLGRKKAR